MVDLYTSMNQTSSFQRLPGWVPVKTVLRRDEAHTAAEVKAEGAKGT